MFVPMPMKSLSFPLFLILFSASGLANEAPEREDVPEKYKWDLASYYASPEEWQADVQKLESAMQRVAAFRGRLSEGGKTLLAAIESIQQAEELLTHLSAYAGFAYYEDLRDSEAAGRFSSAKSLGASYSEATAWFLPELLAIAPKTLERMVESTEGLALYRHYLDTQLRMRPYTLGEKEEALLAAAGDPLNRFNSVFGAFNNADIRFGEIRDEQGNVVELTKARYGMFLQSPDRSVREAAWTALFSEYQKMGNFLAANYDGHVRGRVFEARVRGFDSALQAATYTNGIPTAVYKNVVETLRKGNAPLQRYLDLKRRALGLETMQVWDSYAPVVEPALKDLEFEEAIEIVADGVSPLGEEYLSVYWRGVNERWIDAMETRGKRGGAYSWGSYRSKPYFSMNFDGTFDSVTTIAHEYGHSIHRYLRNRAQPYVYSGARIFLAEVASMTSEAILYQNLLSQAETRDERLFVLQVYLDRFRSSMYRQASLADFEMRAHALLESGQALTRDTLNALYAEVFSDFYGRAIAKNSLNDTEWSRIPHFMRNDNFYVYQYATSFVAAQTLARNILEQGAPARRRFMDLLRAGDSDYPIELLKKAGVDMTTTRPVEDAIELMDRMVDEFEKTLDEETGIAAAH